MYFGETLAARRETDRFIAHTGDKTPCSDRASSGCKELVELRNAEERASYGALLGAAGIGVFLVTGLVTALFWQNQPPAVTVDATPLWLTATARSASSEPVSFVGAQLSLRAQF